MKQSFNVASFREVEPGRLEALFASGRNLAKYAGQIITGEAVLVPAERRAYFDRVGSEDRGDTYATVTDALNTSVLPIGEAINVEELPGVEPSIAVEAAEPILHLSQYPRERPHLTIVK